MITLLVAVAALVVIGSASAVTLPVRVKMTVTSTSCRFSRVVPTTRMQTTLARICSGTEVAHVRLPRLLKKPLTVRHGKSWVIRIQELP